MTDNDGAQGPQWPSPQDGEKSGGAESRAAGSNEETKGAEPPARPMGDRTVVFGAPQLGGTGAGQPSAPAVPPRPERPAPPTMIEPMPTLGQQPPTPPHEPQGAPGGFGAPPADPQGFGAPPAQPAEQPPFGQPTPPPFGRQPHDQQVYGGQQDPYGQPPALPQQPYGQPQAGQPGQPGQPQAGEPAYPQQPYGQPEAGQFGQQPEAGQFGQPGQQPFGAPDPYAPPQGAAYPPAGEPFAPPAEPKAPAAERPAAPQGEDRTLIVPGPAVTPAAEPARNTPKVDDQATVAWSPGPDVPLASGPERRSAEPWQAPATPETPEPWGGPQPGRPVAGPAAQQGGDHERTMMVPPPEPNLGAPVAGHDPSAPSGASGFGGDRPQAEDGMPTQAFDPSAQGAPGQQPGQQSEGLGDATRMDVGRQQQWGTPAQQGGQFGQQPYGQQDQGQFGQGAQPGQFGQPAQGQGQFDQGQYGQGQQQYGQQDQGQFGQGQQNQYGQPAASYGQGQGQGGAQFGGQQQYGQPAQGGEPYPGYQQAQGQQTGEGNKKLWLMVGGAGLAVVIIVAVIVAFVL